LVLGTARLVVLRQIEATQSQSHLRTDHALHRLWVPRVLCFRAAATAITAIPRNRRVRFFTAAGSAGETYNAVRVAIGWRYFSRSEGEAAIALLRRIIAMLWKLTRG
jgi:hypothetical protein